MLNETNLRSLMMAAAKATPSAPCTYSVDGNAVSLDYKSMQETVRAELKELSADKYTFEQNKNLIFKLLEEVATEVAPQRIIDRYASFAEVKRFNQGDKPVFVRRRGRERAKQFVTVVGLAGVYETFKLDNEYFEVKTSAHGAACEIAYEEFLDGRVDFAELLDIIVEGLDDRIYREIAAALISSINQLPAANRTIVNGFDEQEMDRLVATVAAYGRPVIYCTMEFAAKMVPPEGWRSDRMKDERWANGHIANYKGTPVVIMPNSFEDETNSTKIVNPAYVWVMPSGNERPVKVAFEGGTQMRMLENQADWSKRVDVYQKVGVGVMMTNNIGSYIDAQLYTAGLGNKPSNQVTLP